MLKVDFLNVGKGNCTVIKFPSGKLAVIDIDNSKIDDENVSLQDPIDFLEEVYPNENIFRFILTHPDMDHMSGLDALFSHRYVFNFWDTEHDKVLNPDNDDFGNYNPDDWRRYQNVRSGNTTTKTLKLLRNATADCCWVQDNVTILSPSADLIKLSNDTNEDNSDKYNHLSYVLRIEYLGVVILTSGDSTKAAWDDIYEYYKNRDKLELLKADVFLAPHHGSENNINEEVFELINPDYVVISVHRGQEYAYDYYRSLANKGIYTTKHHGNISLTVSAEKKEIRPEKNG